MNADKMLVLILIILLPLTGCLGNEPEPEPEPVLVPSEGLDPVHMNYSDSIDSVTDGGSDNLIDVELISDHEFDWVDIRVWLKIDGGVPIRCYQNNQSADCTFGDGDGDSIWQQNEMITILEGQNSLCDSGGCEIDTEIRLENDAGDVHIIDSNIQQIS